MRQPLVAGNWKMHGSRAENASLVSGLLDLLQPGKRAEILLCPPFPYLMETGRLLKDSGVALGAQSVCAESQGAFTGEVSLAMLEDLDCRFVLVGHSERRQSFGESDRPRISTLEMEPVSSGVPKSWMPEPPPVNSSKRLTVDGIATAIAKVARAR